MKSRGKRDMFCAPDSACLTTEAPVTARKHRRPPHLTPAQRELWRGISRIDQASTRTHGWFVRVGFRARRDGTYVPRRSKFFGDATYGGPRRSLRAARAWRDEQVERALPKRRRKARATRKRKAPR